MQTMTLDHRTPSKAMRHVLADSNPHLSTVSKPMPFIPAAGLTTPAVPVQTSPTEELDAMLIRDPNFGAVHGLRVALLFNVGLALSGLVGWEIWTLLAH